MRYTYAYLVVDGSDAVVIDPGLDTPAGFTAVQGGAAVAGVDIGDITGILVTHYHPDHLGMAGRLRGLSGARVALHEHEGDVLADLIARTPDAGGEVEGRWLDAVDAAPGVVRALRAHARTAGVLMRAQLCPADDRLRDGDSIAVGSRRLVVVHTPGHTPGHLCLVDPDAKLLFTGDHILPTINPNVGLHPGMSGDDPLGDYLAGLERVRAFDDHMALPGHEYAFTGLSQRIDALRAHQRERSETVVSVMRERGPCSVGQVAAALSWSRSWEDFSAGDKRLALATTFAHVRSLEVHGVVEAVGTAPPRYGLLS